MPTNIIMPQMGESIFEGTITKWLKNEGDRVERDEALFEISTDKVDTEIPSAVAGVLQKIICPVGAKVPINTVVAIMQEGEGAGAAPAPAPSRVEKPAAPEGDGDEERVFSSPLVRRMARQEGVELSQIQGTGWKGRITKQDMERHLESRGKGGASAPAPAPKAAARPAPAPAAGGRKQVVPMSTMRTKIAEHMILSRRTSAHVTTVFEIDMSRIVDLRAREKDDYEQVYGVRLTYTHFLAVAAVMTLKEFPVFNASVDGNTIIYHSNVNLGVAVAVPEGLIVPVVKNCEEKSFLGIARGIQDVATRARNKKLAIDDVQGGTFTITNPGSYGGLFATPIINQPQVAILGVGSIEKRPVVIDDAIAVRSMCYLDLSFDHRLIDGLDAEKFMARLKEILQTWNIPIR